MRRPNAVRSPRIYSPDTSLDFKFQLALDLVGAREHEFQDAHHRLKEARYQLKEVKALIHRDQRRRVDFTQKTKKKTEIGSPDSPKLPDLRQSKMREVKFVTAAVETAELKAAKLNQIKMFILERIQRQGGL